MKHKHILETNLTSWFRKNPLKKALVGYSTGLLILGLLIALVKYLIEREKEMRKAIRMQVSMIFALKKK